MAQPPSLGDLKPTYVRVQETHPLPDNRKGVVAKFEQILDLGGVQKVIVELGHPIRVDRLIVAASAPEEAQVPDDDILSAIRNQEVLEFPPGKSAFEDLFKAFRLLANKKLQPALFLVHSLDELDSWLELEKFTHLRELYDVEVRQSPGVEEGTLLFIASDLEDIGAVALTLKMSMETDNEAPSGKGTQERNRRQRNG